MIRGTRQRVGSGEEAAGNERFLLSSFLSLFSFSLFSTPLRLETPRQWRKEKGKLEQHRATGDAAASEPLSSWLGKGMKNFSPFQWTKPESARSEDTSRIIGTEFANLRPKRVNFPHFQDSVCHIFTFSREFIRGKPWIKNG